MVSRILKELELSGNNKPSEEFIKLIENFSPSCKDLGKSVRKIMQRGYKEGFGELETVLLARKILRPRLSRGQLNYWFPIKKKWKSMAGEESSSRHSQNLNSIVKNDVEKSKADIASQTEANNVTLLESKDNSEGETEPRETCVSNSIRAPSSEPEGKTPGPIVVSYFDLTDPTGIDCTNHPMYQRACNKIEQLKRKLADKKATFQGEQNRAIAHDTGREDRENRDYFYVSRDCDFVTEHFKPQIELADAIEYLKKLLERCRKIDFGLRVVDWY